MMSSASVSSLSNTHDQQYKLERVNTRTLTSNDPNVKKGEFRSEVKDNEGREKYLHAL